MPDTFDVIVIGVGAMGASAAALDRLQKKLGKEFVKSLTERFVTRHFQLA